MSNKICLIICYFGKKPNYYELWEQSALCNSDFDFLVFTDIRGIESKDNIHVEYISFSELKSNIEVALADAISLDAPYKLCDYKLFYGKVFEDYLKEYDYWGYCDLDLIFGDLSKFITTNILKKNDKILENGHLTIYKNSEQAKYLYKENGPFPECNADEVIHTCLPCYFDEFTGGIPKALRCLKNVYLNKAWFVDISYLYYDFRDFEGHKYKYFIWNNGKLTSIDEKNREKEILYVHIQKRKMLDYRKNNELIYYIAPGGFYSILPNKEPIKTVCRNIKLSLSRYLCLKCGKTKKDYLDVVVPGYGSRRTKWREYIQILVEKYVDNRG